MSAQSVKLYESLYSRKVAINVLLHDLNESHKKDWRRSISDFLELFIRCVGTTCELNFEKVSLAINNGSLVDYITDLLKEIVTYNDSIFIFVDQVTLEQVEKFFRHFFSAKNPIIQDERWLQFLSVCLFSLANYHHDHCISVGVYFSLRIVHDLEMLRAVVRDQDFSGEEASGGAQVSTNESYLKEQIKLFLGNVSLGLNISRPCFDRIPAIYCVLVRSSDVLYILENDQMQNIINMILIKHKTNKDLLLLLDEVLKHGTHEVKLRVIEVLSNYTDNLFGLMVGDNTSIQVASIKVILAAQRLLGSVSFLLPDQNMIVYNKMTSTNNHMRESAKKFFLLTYKNPNMIHDAADQTILVALMKLVMHYQDSMSGLDTIMNQLWRYLPSIKDLIKEVCDTEHPIAFKILYYYMKKMLEPDIDDVTRKEAIDTYLAEFSLMSMACSNDVVIFEIIMDTLASLDLKFLKADRDMPTIKMLADFIVRKIPLAHSLPTLYMVNVVLRNISEDNVYVKEKTRSMIKELINKFLTDEFAAQQLSAGLYIHNPTKLMPQKKWLALLKTTRGFLAKPESHLSNLIHHVLTIHAELLSAKWALPDLDYAEHAKVVNNFIDLHIFPFITVESREDDKLFCMQVMQALSVIATNFVLNDEAEGHLMWEKLQTTVYKFAQLIAFSTEPEMEDSGSDYHQRRTIINTVLHILEGIQSAERRPINTSFAKFIFLLAKSAVYPEMLERAVAIVYKNHLNSIQIYGSVCHSFTFYPEDKIIKSCMQLIEQVINDSEEDEEQRNKYKKNIVAQYIENVGRYIRHVGESAGDQEQAEEAKDQNRLHAMKFIQGLMKHCSKDERDEIVKLQGEFINQEYLNTKEKESLKAFVKSIS